MAQQTYIAQADIPVPGDGAVAGIVAFVAGDEIPATWFEQHQAWLKDQEEVYGPLVKAVSPAKAAAASAQAVQAADRPQPATPTTP